MAVKKLSDQQVKTYLDMLLKHGEDGLYYKAIATGLLSYASNIKDPELELLDVAEALFIINRRADNDTIFTIGKIFRRAAHTLHRQLQKHNNKNPHPRFLRVVR